MSNIKTIPFWKALFYVSISAMGIWGALYSVWAINEYKLSSRRKNPSYNVVAIAQVCTEGERLQTMHLAALLGLDQNVPSNIFNLDFQALEKRLSSCPAIKKAKVRPLLPSLVHVEYATRTPIALVADYADSAVDADSVLFPIYPFFSAKKLPQLHLGIAKSHDAKWNLGPLSLPELALAQKVLSYAQGSAIPGYSIARVDTNNAYASSGGRREIVCTIEEKVQEGGSWRISEMLVRLNTVSWQSEIALFFKALPIIHKQTGMKRLTIVDMRSEGIIIAKQEGQSYA